MKILIKLRTTTRGLLTRGLIPLLKVILIMVCFILTKNVKAEEFESFVIYNNNNTINLNNDIFKPFRPVNNKRLLSYYHSPGRLIKRNRPYDYYYIPEKSLRRNNQFDYRYDERESNNDIKSISASWIRGKTPRFAVKTNVINSFTSTLNLGAEIRISKKVTFNTSANWNPWTFNAEENTKFKLLLVEPGIRYWACESFNGHFFSIHGHYAYYNIGRLPVKPFTETMNEFRFEGQLAGAGISYGYHWLLSSRWSLDAEIGVGYARLWYGKYPCQTCAKILSNENKNYWGLTRAGFSISYLF